MMQFWMGAAIIVAFMLLPFVIKRRRKEAQVSQLELNKRIFQQRLAELKQLQRQGELTPEEYQQLEAELQAGLLDDAAIDESVATGQGSNKLLWLLMTLVMIAGAAIYAGLGNYREVAHWQQAMAEMPELAKKLRSQTDSMSREEMETFALALRTRLAEDGTDAMGWLLYGRIQGALGREREANEAFTHALQLEPENRTINLSYARTLAISGEPDKLVQARRIYSRLLANKPGDLDVLSQQAFTLFEIGDKQGAYRSWQTMLNYLPKESSRYQQIERTLAMLKDQATAPHGQVKPDIAMPAKDNPANEVIGELVVEAQLNLEQGASLPEKGFVVIFARAVSGSPMPMAVKRIPLQTLPMSVTLSEADSMTEGYKLGSVEPFEVVVKIVQHADVATSAALLEAKSLPLNKADLPLQLSFMLKPVRQ